jgi:hypothetical protein
VHAWIWQQEFFMPIVDIAIGRHLHFIWQLMLAINHKLASASVNNNFATDHLLVQMYRQHLHNACDG